MGWRALSGGLGTIWPLLGVVRGLTPMLPCLASECLASPTQNTTGPCPRVTPGATVARASLSMMEAGLSPTPLSPGATGAALQARALVASTDLALKDLDAITAAFTSAHMAPTVALPVALRRSQRGSLRPYLIPGTAASAARGVQSRERPWIRLPKAAA